MNKILVVDSAPLKYVNIKLLSFFFLKRDKHNRYKILVFFLNPSSRLCPNSYKHNIKTIKNFK